MKRAYFGRWFKERAIFIYSALVSAHGLKNEVYSCVVCLFLADGLKNEGYSFVALLFL